MRLKLSKLSPRTLYSKISISFSVITFLLVGVQFLTLYSFWLTADREHVQRLNWGLARAIARELAPLRKAVGEEPLLAAMGRLTDINPNVDIFILASDGRVVLPPLYNPITVEPQLLESFLAPTPSRSIPIYGPDPREPKRQTPFSAARFEYDGKPAYLYVLLDSEKRKLYRNSLADWYVIKGGAITSFVILLLSTIGGTIIFAWITRRFRMLTKTVSLISAGDLTTRAEARGNDEIAQLGAQINTMADAIALSIAQLDEKDRRRRRLIANISHDLRGPLTAARATAESALDRFSSASLEERNAKFNVVLRNIDILGIFIEQLFELSKLEAKEAEPDREPFSILDVITQDILPKYEGMAGANGIALSADIPEAAPRIHADFRMIYRVLSNLIENALRCTSAGGEVVVRVKQAGTKLAVDIADTGCGIAEEDLPHIFDRFFTSNKSAAGRAGSGLGLAIVKRILELHGEDIHVRSVEGSGTTFTFTLPIYPEDGR